MKKKKQNKCWYLMLLLGFSLNCFAQQFTHKAKLDSVNQNSFYKVLLTPQIIAKMQASCNDLRIVDANNKYIAYFIKQEEATFKSTAFMEFPIIKKELGKDKQTHITITNTTKQNIEHLLLITANTFANRFVNISGSNNLNDWFIIRENIELEKQFNNNQNKFIQSIGLPKVDYAYFKITFIGENVLPINIIQTGIYTQNFSEGKYLVIPTPNIQQKDSSNNKSYVYIKFSDTYMLNRINLTAKGSPYFKRNINVFDNNGLIPKLLVSSTIQSTFTELNFDNLKTKELLLEIINNDDSPLEIQEAKAYQLQKYIITYLEAKKQYHLLFGDSFATKPQYDLSFFQDSIVQNIPILTTGNVETISYSKETVVGSNKKKYFLWISLTLIVTVLLLLSYKMIKEIKKK